MQISKIRPCLTSILSNQVLLFTWITYLSIELAKLPSKEATKVTEVAQTENEKQLQCWLLMFILGIPEKPK